MAKYKVVVHTATNHYTYECDTEESRDKFVSLEKKKAEVESIRINWKYVYKK